MILDQPLNTERLLLRSLKSDDARGPYLDWMRDQEILRFLEVRHDPPSDIRALCAFIEESNAHPTVLLLGIFGPAGQHIGNVKLGASDAHHLRADIGFLIGDRSSWGKGLASEAVDRVALYGLEERGLTKIVAGCYLENDGGRRVLQKAGFVLEATLKEHWYLDGRPQDGLLFARHKGDSFR